MAAGKSVKAQMKQLIPQFVQNHPTCFYQTLLIALSGAAEQLWEEVGFKCPSSLNYRSHKLYSLTNFLGPAFSLWLICLLGCNLAKRLCQGKGWHCRDEKCCSTFCSVVFRTLVIPLAWIFVSLMDGDIFACYYHLPNCTNTNSHAIFIDKVNCTTNALWNDANKYESKICGWYFALICLGLLFVGITISRCNSKRPYFPNFYSNILRKSEQAEMEKFLKDRAKATAEDNAGAITMAMTGIAPKEWEAICMVHQKKTDEKTDESLKEGANATSADNAGAATVPMTVITRVDQKKTNGASKGDKKKEYYYSPMSEFVGNNPDYLKAYQAYKDAKKQASTANSDSAPSAKAPPTNQESAPPTNQEAAPSTTAPPTNQAAAPSTNQEAAPSTN